MDEYSENTKTHVYNLIMFLEKYLWKVCSRDGYLFFRIEQERCMCHFKEMGNAPRISKQCTRKGLKFLLFKSLARIPPGLKKVLPKGGVVLSFPLHRSTNPTKSTENGTEIYQNLTNLAGTGRNAKSLQNH